MVRQPIVRLDLICVVFLGGCVGTALRYALSAIPESGTFPIGTFAANMLACLCYAALSAWLGGTRKIAGRAKEYVNRGFGMGMCGGLSTMSTLALEEFMLMRDGSIAGSAVYVCDSYIKAAWCKDFPMSTFVINVVAGLLAGIVAGLYVHSTISGSARLLLATGFLGGFSTFSTMMNESVTALRAGKSAVFAGYMAVSIIVPVTAVAFGYWIVP